MRIRPIFAWFDLWIGAYWNRGRRRLYIFPVPCFGFYIQFKQLERQGKWNRVDAFYTCNNCKDKHICRFAFDEYNTDGDCLADK